MPKWGQQDFTGRIWVITPWTWWLNIILPQIMKRQSRSCYMTIKIRKWKIVSTISGVRCIPISRMQIMSWSIWNIFLLRICNFIIFIKERLWDYGDSCILTSCVFSVSRSRKTRGLTGFLILPGSRCSLQTCWKLKTCINGLSRIWNRQNNCWMTRSYMHRPLRMPISWKTKISILICRLCKQH